MPINLLSRRSFLGYSAVLPWTLSAHAASSIPVGLELYSVRDELKKDSPKAPCAPSRSWDFRCVEFYCAVF